MYLYWNEVANAIFLLNTWSKYYTKGRIPPLPEVSGLLRDFMHDFELLEEFNRRFYIGIREVTDETVLVVVRSHLVDDKQVQQNVHFSRLEQSLRIDLDTKPGS